MKVTTLLLVGSLTANAALFAVYTFKQPDAGSPSAQAAAAKTSASREGISSTTAGASSARATADQTAGNAWQAFRGNDLKSLADRLRAAGFPASVIRSVLYNEISERTSARRKALLGDVADIPFWKNDSGSGIYNDPKVMAAMRELSKESAQLIKDALGADANDQSEETKAYAKRAYGDLSYDKIEQIQKITSDYSELRQQVYAASNGGVQLPEDREKLALLDKEQRADIAKLLTPQEFAEYDIRTSPTSSQLRSRLATFKPTEDEFRAIYQIQLAADEQTGGGNVYTSEQYAQRQAKQKEVDTQIMGMLPPDRATQYQLATDPAYSQINRIVARFDLPPQAALDVVAVQKDVQQRVTALRTNRELPAAQRTEQLTALQQEAQTKIASTLGPRGFEAYKEYGGQWLQNVVPRPRPTPATPATPGVLPATPLPKG